MRIIRHDCCIEYSDDGKPVAFAVDPASFWQSNVSGQSSGRRENTVLELISTLPVTSEKSLVEVVTLVIDHGKLTALSLPGSRAHQQIDSKMAQMKHRVSICAR